MKYSGRYKSYSNQDFVQYMKGLMEYCTNSLNQIKLNY